MRSLRRQVQHGPTCRSIVILVLGIFILSISTRPRLLRSHLRLGRLSRNDDLRHVLATARKVSADDALESINKEERKFGRGRSAGGEGEGGARGGGGGEGEEDREEEEPGRGTEEAGKDELAGVASDGSASSGSSSEEGATGGRELEETIHVALTSNGSPYLNWQARVMYYSYLKVAKLPGSDMKYFTRILHRSTPDALMDVMPTFRVDPLEPACDNWCEYPVASRPAAIRDWLKSDDVKGQWIFMIETDYVFVKPVAIPESGRPLGFPFGYVQPAHPTPRACVMRYSKGVPPEKVQGTGNAPTLIRYEDLNKIMPYWVEATASVEKDPACKEAFGWVREMYTFSIAAAVSGVTIDLPPMPNAIMSQPPADKDVGTAAVLHYTWGSFFKRWEGGKEVTYWKFEKREFTSRGLPKPFPPLPEGATEAQTAMMDLVNEAIENLPKYTRGELREEGKSEAEIEQYYKDYQARMAAKGGNKGGAGDGAEGEEGGGEGEGEGEGEGKGGEDGADGRALSKPSGLTANSIHTILTSNGNAYMNWQTQIMYYTYQQVAAMEDSDLKFFTRILHRTKDDELSHVIPTWRATPLHPECDGWCEYPVADRADAVLQWLKSGDLKGDWIFMIESDYVFVKPVGIPESGRALGFEFGYIIPTWPTITHIMKRYYPRDLKEIPQTGNAPIVARTDDMLRVIPLWVDITAKFEKDAEAKKELGWVREMYAFSIAAALGGMSIDLPRVPNSIMVQPPADNILGTAAIIHYTWGMEFKDGPKVIWRFDKRDYTAPGQHPPIIAELPSGRASILQELFVNKMNEAIRAIFYEGLHR